MPKWQFCLLGTSFVMLLGYVAFLFLDRNITVMEHHRLGNATYVFDMGWEELSKKTKADILSEDMAIARIIHAKGWTQLMNELFLAYPTH